MVIKKGMKILYVSSLCGPELQKYIWNTSIIKPVQSGQKFHRLLAEGFTMHQPGILEALTSVPVTVKSNSRVWWNLPTEQSGNIRYNYLAFLNFPYIKNVNTFFLSFVFTVRWLKSQKQHQPKMICDALNLSVSTGALLGARIMGGKVAAIVTDLPRLMIENKQTKGTLLDWLHRRLTSLLLFRFDYYILLTPQMNNVVNPKKKPFLVMEGLVDINIKSSENLLEKKGTERILIYAGAIVEKYGIKNLIEAFMKLEDPDVRLHIYGGGDMAEAIPEFLIIDNRIKYMGVVPNDQVVDRLTEAVLLVNPRPTNEEFTKFSFPSKNMEYMASGTPLVTTVLPGMPKEYHQFVYLFNDESVNGIFCTLKFLLSKPKKELHNFGISAKEFVLSKKSNFIQAGRIIDLLK